MFHRPVARPPPSEDSEDEDESAEDDSAEEDAPPVKGAVKKTGAAPTPNPGANWRDLPTESDSDEDDSDEDDDSEDDSDEDETESDTVRNCSKTSKFSFPIRHTSHALSFHICTLEQPQRHSRICVMVHCFLQDEDEDEDEEYDEEGDWLPEVWEEVDEDELDQIAIRLTRPRATPGQRVGPNLKAVAGLSFDRPEASPIVSTTHIPVDSEPTPRTVCLTACACVHVHRMSSLLQSRMYDPMYICV